MPRIERRPILKTTLERSLNPYSSELVEVTRVVGLKVIKGERTLSRRERKAIKDRVTGRIPGIPNIEL